MDFYKKKSNIAHTTSFLEQFKEIDWKETLKSKAARSGLTSLLYSYIFLFMTNEQVTNLDILDINNLPIFIHLFLLAQLIALPNLIINNSSKVWWTEQAQVNEIAGVTNKDVSIPFLPSIKWNLANIDYALIKYNASQIAKLTHLLGFGLPAAFTATAASIGINLSTLGINAGLFAMIGSIWLGQYFLLKQVLNFHQKKYLDNEQTWNYIDRITQSRLGQLFLKTESLRRKFLLRWHKFHIQSPKLMNDFYKVLGLVSLTEIGSETAITKREERRFEKWAHHNDVVSHIESEIDFYEHSQQITKSLRDLQFNFLQYIVQKSNSDGQFASERILTNTFKRQVMVSFNNFAKVVHALFETLKARYSFNEENLSQEESFYSDIWERNKTIEQDDIMDFFEEHLTEKFPHLQQALNFLKDEKFVPSETTEELVALEEVLKEFQVFMENHFEYLLGYIDEQETKNFTYQSGSIVDENTESHFNYSFEKKLRTAASIISSGSAPIESPTYLCAGALEKNR